MRSIPDKDDFVSGAAARFPRRAMRRAFTSTLVALALGGCAIAGKDAATGLAGVPPGKGIAVFSTSADELSLSFSTRLMLVEGASQKKYDKVVIFMDAKLGLTYTYPETNTTVRSLTLPAGDYYLVAVPGNPMMRTVKTPVFKFSVAPGSVQYLGTVHLGQSRLTLQADHRDRDMAYFLDKNPALRGVPVAASPFSVDRYLAPESGDTFEIKGTIWDAPQ